MSEESKPCPFCGGHGEVRKRTWEINRFQDGTVYFVKCELCGSKGAEKSSRDAAIRSWNTRVGDKGE